MISKITEIYQNTVIGLYQQDQNLQLQSNSQY